MKSLSSQEIYKANGCVNHLPNYPLIIKSVMSYSFSVPGVLLSHQGF
jgi:hypothetical protein